MATSLNIGKSSPLLYSPPALLVSLSSRQSSLSSSFTAPPPPLLLHYSTATAAANCIRALWLESAPLPACPFPLIFITSLPSVAKGFEFALVIKMGQSSWFASLVIFLAVVAFVGCHGALSLPASSVCSLLPCSTPQIPPRRALLRPQVFG